MCGHPDPLCRLEAGLAVYSHSLGSPLDFDPKRSNSGVERTGQAKGSNGGDTTDGLSPNRIATHVAY